MGAAWASFVFNVVAYAVTDVVVSRRLPPAGRSYLWLLLFLAGLLLAGLHAGLLLRLVLLAGAVLGSLALSPPLRQDVVAVWKARRPGGAA